MNGGKRILVIVLINIGSILLIIGLFVVGPILVIKTSNLIQNSDPDPLVGHYQSYLLPNYENVQWAGQYFEDQRSLSTRYADFTVWEFNALETPTINIDDDGHRYTVIPEGAQESELWMFGGSTMYGTGSDDAHTLPSLLAEQLGVKAVNNGGSGYIARQSISRLIREYKARSEEDDGNRTIIFLDGINDVYTKCRTENIDLVTARQGSIRQSLEDSSRNEEVAFRDLLGPAELLFDRISRRLKPDPSLSPEDLYVCDDDAYRAEQVAKALVADWKAAQSIAEGYGDSFVAVLQPVLFLSDTRADHLFSELSPFYAELTEQYKSVYPLVRSVVRASGVRFEDLTDVFDRDEYIYIDPYHVSPNGNEYMARELAALLSQG